jgi:predicted nucleic acid-binding protein
MQVVIDTNVLISALMAKTKTFEIIVFGDLDMHVPEYSLEEIERHKEELRERMHIPDDEFDLALDLILSHVTVVNREKYRLFESHAKKICPDQNDFPFFALALAMGTPLWSNDKRLKDQKEIIVYNTKDMANLLLD